MNVTALANDLELFMSLFGKPWREIFSFRHGKKEKKEEYTYRNNVKIGDMVLFCANPPEDKNHCNIWEWKTGILIDVDLLSNRARILSEGDFFEIGDEWVGPIDMLGNRDRQE